MKMLFKGSKNFLHRFSTKTYRTKHWILRSFASYCEREYADEHIHDTTADNCSKILSYVEKVEIPLTGQLKIITPTDDIPSGVWPAFRVMDEDGSLRKVTFETAEFIPDENIHDNKVMMKLISKYPDNQFLHQSDLFRQKSRDWNLFTGSDTANLLLKCHQYMIRLKEMDDVLLNAQRQGRISFYLTCRGEEAITIGAAAALVDNQDVLLTQYREQGLFLWRGFTLEQFTSQTMSNDLDLGKGRQMPIHYGSRSLNIHTVSSCLGTQIPQAVGVGYKMKLEMLSDPSKPKRVSVAFFGEGASSTGDFHSAANFAATLKVPVIFFCRNNGYAISTKVTEQYKGDGIVVRGHGYGMAAIRVDGNDVCAVFEATNAAKKYALEHSEPVLIEAITYRQAHHSTSDDSFSYRDKSEVEKIATSCDPFKRLDSFLVENGFLHDDQIKEMKETERNAVKRALLYSEKRPGTKQETMFRDVFEEMPLNLKRQEQALLEHIKKYK